MKKQLSLMLVAIPLFLGLSFITADAADMNYSVTAKIPENQIDKKLTYFDLKMTPGQQQTISLVATNSSDEPIMLTITPHTATTNKNGVIDYSQQLEKKDSSLIYDFSEYISGETKIALQPKEIKEVNYQITMPNESFNGILLGGFYIKKEMTTKDEEQEKAVQIRNEYSYVIGVKLSESEGIVTPKLKLNQVKPALQNYRTAISANIQNTEPTIISGLEVDAKVYQKNSKKVLHHTEKSQMAMAPNSNFDFNISWDNQELKPGKYYLTLEAKDKTAKHWKFEKEFEIKKEESNHMNQKAVEIESNNTIWYSMMLAIAIVVIVILVLLLVMKKKKTK